MLFSLGHGQHIVQEDVPSSRRGEPARAAASIDAMGIASVAPGVSVDSPAAELRMALATANGEAPAEDDAAMVCADEPVNELGKFRYYFPEAAGLPERQEMPDLLDALADSMVEASGDPADKNSNIPAAFTYFGQFIDHDVTANTDRDDPQKLISIINGAITPLPRADVTSKLANLRDGSLGLDSLYGDGEGQGPFALKLAGLMRFPGNRAKMRLAVPSPIGDRPPLPTTDNATDLLRLGFLLDHGLVTADELRALQPQDLRDTFVNKDTNEPIRERAIIGDARNDENLLVAQMQVLFLRFHNKLADATGGTSFRRAQRLTRWHYQWLVANEYLPTVCDPAIVSEVAEMEAPLYGGFFSRHGGGGPKLPMPLEFSLAAFRFAHSMVRGAYDYNRFFGEADGAGGLLPEAPFDQLFAFTGDGGMPAALPTDPANVSGQLPRRWVIEWERFIKTDAGRPRRATRKIDTDLAPPLNELRNQPDGVFKHLARRNLRRGYRLNIASAQECVAAVQAAGYKTFPVLSAEQLCSGSEARRAAVIAGGFDTVTPLWFYVLKEAETLADGQHLGPLGSHLVANTLLGLIINDADSYWNADGGHWSPSKFKAHHPIDSLEKVMRFADMLA